MWDCTPTARNIAAILQEYYFATLEYCMKYFWNLAAIFLCPLPKNIAQYSSNGAAIFFAIFLKCCSNIPKTLQQYS